MTAPILAPSVWIPKIEAFRRESDDPDSQIGVLIAHGENIITHAVNAIPEGLAKLPERLCRPAKYDFIEHAERSAIGEAAKWGLRLYGATLYMVGMGPPTLPCVPCARLIIKAGIRTVVATGYKPLPEHWIKECEEAGALLKEAGVAFIEVPWDKSYCK